MVTVISNLTFRSRNWFLVGFQLASYYGKARRSGTAGTVPHAPCIEYGQNGQSRDFAHHNWRNTIPHQGILCQSPSREDERCCFWSTSNVDGCDRKTPGYGLLIILQTAAFLSKNALQWVCRHAGDVEAWVHLHLNQHHPCPECQLCHLRHLVTMCKVKYPNWKVCHLDMCIHRCHFLVLSFSIIMHLPRIASAIKTVFQISRLMKEQALVSIVPAAWLWGRHPFCRWEQAIERSWKWTGTLIDRNRIIECIIIYN